MTTINTYADALLSGLHSLHCPRYMYMYVYYVDLDLCLYFLNRRLYMTELVESNNYLKNAH